MSAFPEMIDRYRRFLDTSTNTSVATRKRYLYEVGRFSKFFEGWHLEDVQAADILAWHQTLCDNGEAQQTIQQRHSSVKSFLRYLDEFEDDDHAGRLLRAARRLKAPKDRKPVRANRSLTEEEFDRLLAVTQSREEIGVRDRAMLHFLWATGARRAEVSGLLMEDLHLEARTARVTGKGDKTRFVVFDEPCRQALDEWLKERPNFQPNPGVEHVFVSALGNGMSAQFVTTMVGTTAKEAGLKGQARTHLFRHTRITQLLNNGMAVQDVAKFAGHTNPATTMRYFQQTSGELRDRYDRATAKAEPDRAS